MTKLSEKIAEAKKISETTDANMQGALSQVANTLTIEDCQEIITDHFSSDEKKLNRWEKKLKRAIDDHRYYGINGLRSDMFMLLESVLRTLG